MEWTYTIYKHSDFRVEPRQFIEARKKHMKIGMFR